MEKGLIIALLMIAPLSCFNASTDYKVTGSGEVYSYDLITKGPWVDARAYSTLTLADTAACRAGKTLLIAQNCTLTANTTLSAAVYVVKGGGFTKASTYTLNFSGAFEAGPYQVFSGFSAGEVSFKSGTVKEINPIWWASPITRMALASAVTSITGGIVKIPTGTIDLDGKEISLSGKSNITIRGSGFGTILDNSGNNARVFNLANSSDITVENIQFLGDFDTTRYNFEGAIITDNTRGQVTTNIAIRGCYFNNLAGDAIRLGPGTSYVEISSNLMISGLGFIEMAGTVATGQVHDVKIFGNTVRASVMGGRGLGSDDIIDTYGGLYKVTIYGNTFDLQGTLSTKTTANSAILLNPAGAAYGEVRDISITGNAFYNCNNDGTISPHSGAIYICGDTDNAAFESISIVGNTFYNVRHGIIYSATSPHGKPILISGNTINKVSYRGISVFADYASIQGNLIKDISGAQTAIYLQGNGVNCSNNTIYNLQNAATGIWSDAGNDRVVSNNLIDKGAAGTKGILVADTRGQYLFNTVINILGTAISVNGVASNASLIGNKFYGNGTNLRDGGKGTTVNTFQTP